MIITIYGASDDLVEVYGCEGEDEFPVSPRSREIVWAGDLLAPDGESLPVVAAFFGHGWHVGAGVAGEESSVPGWAVKIRRPDPERGEPSYSIVLEVDAPEGTRLVNVRRAGEDW